MSCKGLAFRRRPFEKKPLTLNRSWRYPLPMIRKSDQRFAPLADFLFFLPVGPLARPRVAQPIRAAGLRAEVSIMFSEFRIDPADLKRFADKLTAIDRKVLPAATRLALNDMAFDVFNKNKDLMRRVFDAPTPFTMRAFWVQKATPQNLEAVVERRGVAGRRHFLEVQQDAGRRGATGFERLLRSRLRDGASIVAIVPTAALPRNAFGNVTAGTYRRIANGLQTSAPVGRGGKASRRASYFVPAPNSNLSRGVYERRGETLRKLLSFTDRAPSYDARFPMEAEAAKNARAAAPAATERALKTAMQRLLSRP